MATSKKQINIEKIDFSIIELKNVEQMHLYKRKTKATKIIMQQKLLSVINKLNELKQNI